MVTKQYKTAISCLSCVASTVVDKNIQTCARMEDIGTTTNDRSTWWYVNLGGIYSVYNIRIQYKDYDGFSKYSINTCFYYYIAYIMFNLTYIWKNTNVRTWSLIWNCFFIIHIFSHYRIHLNHKRKFRLKHLTIWNQPVLIIYWCWWFKIQYIPLLYLFYVSFDSHETERSFCRVFLVYVQHNWQTRWIPVLQGRTYVTPLGF